MNIYRQASLLQIRISGNTSPSPPQSPHSIILLVDDETDIVSVFAKFLQRNGYDINAFSDPAKAADFFAADPDKIALVITDLKMPQMSGIELASRIRALSAKVKIILMTAFETADYRDDIKRLEFASIVRKPVTPANMKMIVEKTLSV
jgi:DNA-binding NtrC family response regulator